MTVKSPFEKFTHLFFGRGRRAAATVRSVRACPRIETVEERTLLSSLGGMVHYGSDAAASLQSGTSSQSPVAQAVIDLARDGSGNTPASGNQGASFVGDFDGQTDLISVNANSNNLTIISGYDGPNPVITTMPSGGVDPELAFTFHTDNGFDNLAVGNTGNGVLAIFAGTPTGLELQSQMAMRELRHASALEFLGASADSLSFYVVPKSNFGGVVEALSLSASGGFFSNHLTTGTGTLPSSSNVAQLVPLQESSLALIGTLLPLSTNSSPAATPSSAGDVVETPSVPASTTAGSFGQPLLGEGIRFPAAGRSSGAPTLVGNSPANVQNPSADGWQHYMLGTKGALDQFDREHPELSIAGSHDAPLADLGNRPNAAGSAESAVSVLRPSPAAIPSQPSSATANANAATIDQVIDQLGRHDLLAERRSGPNEGTLADRGSSSGLSEARSQLSACLVITTVGAGCLHFGAERRRRRASGRKIEAQGRQMT